MPPLLAAIPMALMAAGEVAITGATLFGLSVATSALVAGGITLALGTVMNALSSSGKNGSPNNNIGDIGPSRSPFSVVPDSPRTWAYGKACTGGVIKYWLVDGVDNSDLYFVVTCQDSEIDGFEQQYIDNEVVDFAGGAVTTAKWLDANGNPTMWRTDYLGAEDQLADANVIAASGGEWTVNHRLRGVAYYVWKLKYDSKVYASGIPTPAMVIRGRKVWDPRFDADYGGDGSQSRADPSTWAWSQNAALCLLDYLLGVFMNGVRIGGCGVPIARLDIDSFIAAANICDEDVALDGGGTEKRYTMNGFVDAIEDKNQVVSSMLQAMVGVLVYSSGKIAVIAGAAQTTIMSLDDDDLAGALNLTPTVSRQEKTNSITSIYAEPAQIFQVVSAPPLIVPDYETADGGLRLEKEIRHRFTTSVATVQRINKLVLGNFREQLSIDAIFKPKALKISVGQTFTWSSATAGYVNQKMICLSRELQENGSIRLIARQETDSKYSWATTEQQDPPSFQTQQAIDPSLVTAPLSGDVSVTGVNLTNAAGASVPALLLTANEPPSPFVESIITVWRANGDTNWHSGPTIEPVRPPGPAYITGVAPNVSYDVGFAYVSKFGVSSYTVKSSITSGANLISTGATVGSITGPMIAAGAIDATKFAAGLTEVKVVGALPGSATEGDVAVLTTDGKLYRYHSGAWTAAVPTVDLTGTITTAQIAAGAVDYSKVASGLSFVQVVSSLPGSAAAGSVVLLTTDNKLYRWTGSAWTALIATSDLSGTIVGSQVAANTLDIANMLAKDASNLIANPVFAGGVINGWSGSVVSAVAAAAAPAGCPTAYCGNFTSRNHFYNAGSTSPTFPAYDTPAGTSFSVAPGEHYYFAITAATPAVGGSPYTLDIEIEFAQRDGTAISNNSLVSLNPTSAWTTISGIIAVPANCAWMALDIGTSGSSAFGAGWYITNIICRRATDNGLVVASAITSDKIAAGTITATNIASATITGSLIAAGTITASNISASTITSSQIASGTIVAGNIAAGTITGSLIAGGTITASNLAANSVTAGKIAANAVTAGTIDTNAVTAGTIAAGAINASAIVVNDIIVTGHLVANAVSDDVSQSFGTTSIGDPASVVASITMSQVNAYSPIFISCRFTLSYSGTGVASSGSFQATLKNSTSGALIGTFAIGYSGTSDGGTYDLSATDISANSGNNTYDLYMDFIDTSGAGSSSLTASGTETGILFKR